MWKKKFILDSVCLCLFAHGGYKESFNTATQKLEMLKALVKTGGGNELAVWLAQNFVLLYLLILEIRALDFWYFSEHSKIFSKTIGFVF